MDALYFFLLALYGFCSAFFGFCIACLLFAAKKDIPQPEYAKDAALERAFKDIAILDNKSCNMQCCGNCQGFDDCVVMNPGEVCANWRPDNGLYLERRDMHDINVAFVMRQQEAKEIAS